MIKVSVSLSGARRSRIGIENSMRWNLLSSCAGVKFDSPLASSGGNRPVLLTPRKLRYTLLFWDTLLIEAIGVDLRCAIRQNSRNDNRGVFRNSKHDATNENESAISYDILSFIVLKRAY